MNIPNTMELIFLDQILIAISLISLFVVIMLTLMICLPYCCTKPAWEKLKNEEMELESTQSFMDSNCHVDSDVLVTVLKEDEERLI